MTKFLNKWFRKIHRWLVIPFIILLVLILITKDSQPGNIFQRIQAPLMIIMAITGGYLWLIPYISKWKRNQRNK